MENNLNDKTAIVCGSTDGIGKSIALLMANRGCQIILVARNQDKLDSTLSELKKIKPILLFVRTLINPKN